LHKELESGRWVVLQGERSDIEGVKGVKAAELMMVASLVHGYDPSLAGDKVHTTLKLATRSAFRYKRDTVIVYGNVVRATHGETRNELLGNGDAAEALQSFSLKRPAPRARWPSMSTMCAGTRSPRSPGWAPRSAASSPAPTTPA
jgi:hypothetical protein